MKTRLDLLKDNFQPQVLHKIIDYEIKIKDLNRRLLKINLGADQGEAIRKKIIEEKKSLELLNSVLTIILEMIKQEEKND